MQWHAFVVECYLLDFGCVLVNGRLGGRLLRSVFIGVQSDETQSERIDSIELLLADHFQPTPFFIQTGFVQMQCLQRFRLLTILVHARLLGSHE